MQKDGVPISLCMVVWNEEKTIERTIRTVQNIVSEIVIGIDKASTDKTREEIKRLSNELTDIKWVIFNSNLHAELAAKKSLDADPEWGFCKARNAAFDRANLNAWRIILDGHELVVDQNEFAAWIQKAAAAGSDCMDVSLHFEPAADGIPASIFESARAGAPETRYNNPIHNVLAGKRHYKAPDVVIEHRKSAQAKKSRAERNAQRSNVNIGGLEKKALEKPDNSRTWFYLATAYKENKLWEKAVNAFDEYLLRGGWPEERWTARMDKGHCLVILGREDEARTSYALAIDEFPPRAEAHYYLGNLAYKQQRFGEAEAWLEKCVSMPMPKCRLFLVPRVYLVMRHDLLSMVYHHNGKPRQALEQAEIALKAASNSRIEKNVMLWRASLKDAS